jgi:hypothetical protein
LDAVCVAGAGGSGAARPAGGGGASVEAMACGPS